MVSIKTLKLLLTIKLRNYYRSHVLPLTSLQKNKTNNKNTKIEKSKIDGFLGFHQKKTKKQVNNKKVTKSWTCLVGHWVSCLNSSSLCAGLSSASLKDGMGSGIFVLNLFQGKVKAAKKELMRSPSPKRLEETEIKR